MADFRDMDASTDCEPSENETGFAGHPLSTDWEEPDLPQVHISDPLFRKSSRYNGPAADKTEAQALFTLRELLRYFAIGSAYDMPNPPQGLPGATRMPGGVLVRKFLQEGFAYSLAAINHEPRRMHNIWNTMNQLIWMIKHEAAKEREQEIFASLAKRENERQNEVGAADPKPQLVYFIGSESGPIKIGIASSPIARLKSLQTGHHERLELLATCEGGQPLEYAYHQRFAQHRLAGEWFTRCSEIVAEIERLAPNPSLGERGGKR